MINKPETIQATSFFISFIYLYYISFEEVNLFKPYTSDSTSGEFYVIGKGFKGIEEKQLDKLYTILNKFKVNNAIFPKEVLPDTFINQISNFLDLLTKHNIKGYEKQNLLLNCYKAEMTKNKKIKKTTKTRTNYTTTVPHTNNQHTINTTIHNTNEKSCNLFMNEKNIENILIPRYNQWIKINEFE